mmetsp:Transcript_21929/g.87039  ORF Transcript_21929/g.87039 Transcript_21929/m.87039 type:complete len:273 (-) Transcript_21929:468-1286(-)
MLSNVGYLRNDSGSTRFAPGTSAAQTTASNSRNVPFFVDEGGAGAPSSGSLSAVAPLVANSVVGAAAPETTTPLTRVGRPVSGSTSCTMSRIAERRFTLTPRSSRYFRMGSCRYVCGEPSSMRSTEASVRIAKSMKIVSMHRAEMWSQSMKPSAYAMGSHMRSIEPREPPLPRNHSEKVTSSSARTTSMPPSKSTRARTMGDVPSASALAALSKSPSCSVLAKAWSPETGAPIGKRKSRAPSEPPSLTNVWTCSLSRSMSKLPVRSMMPNKL